MISTTEDQIDLSSINIIRVICRDPYATESSSEDESISGKNSRRPIKPKRRKTSKLFVSEICVRKLIERSERELNPNSEREKTATGNRKSSSGFKGVRRRPWGKFAAEIRNPFEKKRKWLGTFATVEAAAEAYEKTKREFERQLGVINLEENEVDSTKPCDSEIGLSKPEVELTKPATTINTSFVVHKTSSFVYDDEELGAIDRMLEDPPTPSSISDIFGDSVLESNDFWVDYDSTAFDSILDDLKFDFVENGELKKFFKMGKEESFGFTNGDGNSDVASNITNIFDDRLFESTDFVVDQFDQMTHDFSFKVFPKHDFRCSREVDDNSSFIGTSDWIDRDL